MSKSDDIPKEKNESNNLRPSLFEKEVVTKPINFLPDDPSFLFLRRTENPL